MLNEENIVVMAGPFPLLEQWTTPPAPAGVNEADWVDYWSDFFENLIDQLQQAVAEFPAAWAQGDGPPAQPGDGPAQPPGLALAWGQNEGGGKEESEPEGEEAEGIEDDQGPGPSNSDQDHLLPEHANDSAQEHSPNGSDYNAATEDDSHIPGETLPDAASDNAVDHSHLGPATAAARAESFNSFLSDPVISGGQLAQAGSEPSSPNAYGAGGINGFELGDKPPPFQDGGFFDLGAFNEQAAPAPFTELDFFNKGVFADLFSPGNGNSQIPWLA